MHSRDSSQYTSLLALLVGASILFSGCVATGPRMTPPSDPCAGVAVPETVWTLAGQVTEARYFWLQRPDRLRSISPVRLVPASEETR